MTTKTTKKETMRQMVVRIVAESFYRQRKSSGRVPNFAGRPIATYEVLDHVQEMATENKGQYLGLVITKVLDHVKTKGTEAKFTSDVNKAARMMEWEETSPFKGEN